MKKLADVVHRAVDCIYSNCAWELFIGAHAQLV